MDEQRAEFEAWAMQQGMPLDMDERHGDYKRSHTLDAWITWQAATQRQQERIAELEAQVAALTTALFECREAFPIPDPGSPLEPAWMGAMTDPEDVPEYVKAQVQALSLDAGRYRFIRDNCNRRINIEIDNAGMEISDTVDASIDAAIAAGKGEG